MRDPEATIGKMLDAGSKTIISSVDEEGYPNTKAMNGVRMRQGIRYLYFSTNTSSMRVRQYRQNPKACVYVFDARFFRGVMLKGSMEVLEDAASKAMIWRKGDTRYYAEGVSDPDYCVLRFTATGGRYDSHLHSEDFGVPALPEEES